MMNANNPYLEEIERIGHEYEAARVERQNRKVRIIEEFGYDSPELKAWRTEDSLAVFPLGHLQSLPSLEDQPCPPGG